MTYVNVNPGRKNRRRKHNFWATPFDNIINELANGTFADIANKALIQSHPAVNVRELEDSFILDVAVPGLSKKDISINVEKDQLTISASKEVDAEKETTKMTRKEFDYSNFKRSFRLSEKVDTTNIKAAFKNGVLTITIAKKEEAKDMPPREINIL